MNTLSAFVTALPIAWRKILLLLAPVILLDLLFWDQFAGANVAIASTLLVIMLGVVHPWQHWTGRAKGLAAAVLFTGALVVLRGSVLSMLMNGCLLLVLSAFVLEPALRSVPGALAQSASNFFSVPLTAFEGVGGLLPEKGATRTGWRWLKLALLPVGLLILYYWIYRLANPVFEELTAGFMASVANALERFFKELFTAHALFLICMAVLCGGLLFRLAPGLVAEAEAKLSDALVRISVKRPHWMAPLAMNALERERRIALLLLVMMNALLLFVNIVDIDWVWFNFTMPEGFSLKQFVHEGTWLLIISILLSMVILLHFFRRNLNFHPKAGWLRRLALIWVAQNGVLAISVLLRNMHYIGFHGLAYKRIGVIVFLLLVFIGLVTLAWKIHTKRSNFHLVRVNAWAAMAVMIMVTCFDWDGIIVRHNLGHPNPAEIDTDNYLALGDGVLPLLHANKEVVAGQMLKHSHNRTRWTETQDPQDFSAGLAQRTAAFMTRWETTGWQGWTWSGQRTYDHLATAALTGTRTP